MASDKTETKVTLKILVDTKNKKVLFAEAGKDFVDFILHIMSLPLGSVVKLLKHETLEGCIGDLYKSVESLNTQYFLSIETKDLALNPKTTVNVPLLSINGTPSDNKCYYKCSYVSDSSGMGGFGMNFTRPDGVVKSTSNSGGNDQGYVKGLVTYMVMDNLEVKPMSTISGIALINKFHVKDLSCLEEKDVQVGLKEGLAILKASLETKDVLTTVFLGQKIMSTSFEI